MRANIGDKESLIILKKIRQFNTLLRQIIPGERGKGYDILGNPGVLFHPLVSRC